MKKFLPRFVPCLLVPAAVFAVQAPILAEEVTLGQGVMQFRWQTGGTQGPEGEIFLDLPLKKTRVDAEVSGFVAQVTVQQFFSNSTQNRIEAIYKFPLPANAAVHESAIRVGDRLVLAEIKERAAARKKYEKAKAKGKRASLLEQERPNIFTQSVANIGPGEEIVVAIKYVQELKFDDGRYTFTFPMTVGPRFNPGSPTGKQGTGSSCDTTEVPDASRITAPVLPPGMRTGHDIELTVRVDGGFPIRDIEATSHDVFLDWEEGTKAVVSLTPGDRIPDKDFILEYSTIGDDLETALLTHKDGDVGYFLLMVQPPSEVAVDEAVPKELVFVLDCSGSMSGFPMATSKAVMRKFIAGMNPFDTFQVIRFSESASSMSRTPLANTPENRARGLAYVDRLSGGGGTYMIEGIKSALDFPADPLRQRMVFFLTDGYIGNETAILAAIREKVGDTRLYSLGVGSSPNRYLLDEMAREGRGFSQYVRNDQDPEPLVERFYRRLNLPVLTAVETDWGQIDVTDQLPTSVPDLFDRQPVFLIGRYTEPGSGTFFLRGRQGLSWAEIPVEVDLPRRETDNASLRLLWARRQIGELMHLQVEREIPEVKARVLELALEHSLMSKYTSFVAVERKLKEGIDLPLDTILIPSELPEGVSYEGNFGKPELSMQRIKPGDPVLAVRAPEEALSVKARFPFGLEKSLERDPETGLWVCRFLVPRSEAEGRYQIRIRIELPDGDWIDTTADYVVDATPPRFDVEARLVGREIVFRARPLSGVFEDSSERVGAWVIPDVQSIGVRPPQGGFVELHRQLATAGEGSVWEGRYQIPSWYTPGSYSFRFMAVDAARNSYSREVSVRLAEQGVVMGAGR